MAVHCVRGPLRHVLVGRLLALGALDDSWRKMAIRKGTMPRACERCREGVCFGGIRISYFRCRGSSEICSHHERKPWLAPLFVVVFPAELNHSRVLSGFRNRLHHVRSCSGKMQSHEARSQEYTSFSIQKRSLRPEQVASERPASKGQRLLSDTTIPTSFPH